MFDTLSDRLGSVFDRLKGRGALSEQDVRDAMREVRIALELLDRNDDAARTAGLASRIEHKIATLPAVQQGLHVVVTQFLRSRAERRPRNLRAVLLEYRFKILET